MAVSAPDMSLYSFVRPLLFALDAETVHNWTIRLLASKNADYIPPDDFDDALASEVAGLRFPSPVGLAAGLDKNARAPWQFLGMGFGFVEVGTLTPLPQPGNPKPRLFRLAQDEAIINRMGFNNAGQTAALDRLARLRRAYPKAIVGVNIGANKDSADRIADYAQGVARMGPAAAYLTVNVSSPNTPGLRGLQDGAALAELLDAVNAVRNAKTPPIFLKVAPDLEPEEVETITALVIEKKIDALIVANTTLSRPSLISRHANESGGLSGAPLNDLAMQRLKDFRMATKGKIPLVAVGGIDNADEAYARIRAGASLIQLYSALIYHGPSLVGLITQGLAARLHADGFAHIKEAVGVDV